MRADGSTRPCAVSRDLARRVSRARIPAPTVRAQCTGARGAGHGRAHTHASGSADADPAHQQGSLDVAVMFPHCRPPRRTAHRSLVTAQIGVAERSKNVARY